MPGIFRQPSFVPFMPRLYVAGKTAAAPTFKAAWADNQQNIVCGGLNAMYRKNTAGQFICFNLKSTTDGSAVTGATVAVRRCIDGTFAAGGGTVTEDSAGLYKYAMSQADTNGNDISFFFTATGALSVQKDIVTTACDPTTATNFGITSLPTTAVTTNASLLTSGTGTDQLSVSAGKVLLQATQTGVTIPTVTTVTNQLTAAAIATGVWQDATAGDFTTASSIGKCLYIANIAPGTANGLATVGASLTIGTNNDKTGYTLIVTPPTAATIATTVWQDLLAGADFGTALSIGALLKTDIDATISSRLATSGYTAPTNLTAAQIATGVWQDTTAGDFTTALSVGKSIMNGVSLGTGLTINGYTGNTPQTGDVYARVGAAGVGLTNLGDTRIAHLDADVSSRMATYTQPTGFLAATFPSGTIANTTNLTAGTIATVTNRVTANTDQVNGVTQTGGDIFNAITNIAVTSAALNTTSSAESITTGTETNTYTSTATLDGVYHSIADVAGTTDFYYEFDISGTTGAVGVGVTWDGYLAGVANTMKVYARNWGGAAWDQVGTITGIASANVMSAEYELTSAHTGTGGNVGKVRIRFSNTGLTASSLKTDRVLLGYAVVLTPPANWSSMSIDAFGRIDIGKWIGTAPLALSAQQVQAIVPSSTVVASVTAAVVLPSIPANWITAAGINAGAITSPKFATDAIDSNALAASAVTEIQSGLSTLTQAQVTGGAYALNNASFSFNAGLDFTATQKTSLNAATPASVVGSVGSMAPAGVDAFWDETMIYVPWTSQGDVNNRLLVTVRGYFNSAVTPLQPAVAGRALGVNAAGQAGVDWANVGGQSTAVNLSATTTNLVNTAGTVTLAATQPNYAPAKQGDLMGIVDAAITDAKFSVPALSGPATGVVGMLFQLWRRFFKKVELNATTGKIKTYADDGTTVVTTQDASDTSTVQTQGPAA